MIKNHEFSQLFPRGTKLPQIDAIRDTLKVMDIEGLKQVNYHIVKTAINNKVFENGTIDGYTVVAIDGTKFFGSNKITTTSMKFLCLFITLVISLFSTLIAFII
jgi:hypothetical protein